MAILKRGSIIFILATLLFIPSYAQKWEKKLYKLEVQFYSGFYKKANAGAEKLKEKIRKKNGGDNFFSAKAMLIEALSKEALGRFNDIERLVTNANSLIVPIYGEESNEYLEILNLTTQVYVEYGDYPEAIVYLKKAKEAAKGSDIKPKLANDININEARILHGQGYFNEAVKLYSEASGFMFKHFRDPVEKGELGNKKTKTPNIKQVKERRRMACDVIHMRIQAQLDRGDYKAADSALTETFKWIRKDISPKDMSYAHHHFLRGLFYEHLLNLKDARKNYDKAIKGINKGYGGYRLNYAHKRAVEYRNRAILNLVRLNQNQEAKKMRKVAEAKIRKYYVGKDNIHYGRKLLVDVEELMIEGNMDKAKEKLEFLIDHPEIFPKHHLDRTKTHILLYRIYLDQGDEKNAKKHIDKYLELSSELYGDETPNFHVAKINLARYFLHYADSFDEAELIYKESFDDVVAKQFNPKEENYVSYIYDISLLYELTDRFQQAEEYIDNALEILKSKYGNKHIAYAEGLQKKAALLIELGKYNIADKQLNYAISIFEGEIKSNISKKDDNLRSEFADAKNAELTSIGKRSYSLTLETMAELQVIYGLYDDAKKTLKKAYRKDTEDNYKEELAALYIQTGKFSATERLLTKSIEDKEERFGLSHRSLIFPTYQLASLYLVIGKYTDAEKLAKRSTLLAESIFGDNSLKYATSLKVLGQIYAAIGDYEKAEETLTKVYNIQKEQYGDKHIQTAKTLNELSLVRFYNGGDNDKIEKDLWEVADIIKGFFGKNHPQYADDIKNLTIFYIESGNPQKVGDLTDKANEIYIETFGKKNDKSAEIYYLKGMVAYKTGNYTEAVTHFEESVDMYDKVLGKDNPKYLKAYGQLGKIYYITGEYDESIDILNETIEEYLSLIEGYFPYLSEREKAKFWQKIRSDFEFYNSLAVRFQNSKPELVSNAYNSILSTKALLLTSSIKVRQRILKSGDPELIQLYNDWNSKKEYLTQVLSMTQDQLKENEINLKDLENEIEGIEKKLGEKSTLFAESFESKKIEWQDISEKLKADEVAIEITSFKYFDKDFTDSTIYMAMIITNDPDKYPEVVTIGNGNEMESKILKFYRNNTKFGFDDEKSYTVFWEQIEKKLKGGVKTIYLSGDGVYNQINLETLKMPDGRYVIDKHNIVLVSNTKDIVTRKKAPEDIDREVVLIGNPLYYTNSTRKKNVPQLPGAEKEVEIINTLLNKKGYRVSKHINEAAQEDHLKENIESPKILHVATHGFFMEDENDLSNQIESKALQNPMLRSGLLLTGGGHLMDQNDIFGINREEGILTAAEASNLNLDNTEIVVLSACETAKGDVQVGEGVYGLQRAFLVAGADAIIMSLFKVSDEVTVLLMESFYDNWINKNMPKRKAFIEAKKIVREEYSDPIYWGSFVMVGID